VMIFCLARKRGWSQKRTTREKIGVYHLAQVALYNRFVFRRKFQRKKTTRKWLRANFKEIVSAMFGDTRDWSEGWVSGFCVRWDISSQCRTNKHTYSLTERSTVIRRFHRWLIYELQPSGFQRCPKYGRFPADCVYFMDQSPLAFCGDDKRTLSMKGQPCNVKQKAGSSDKRFCTLQITICGDPGNLRIDLELIFSGQGNLSTDELEFHKSFPGIKVRWQEKAWADEKIMIAWLEDFRERTLDQGEVLLGMDRHGSQKTPLCRMFMKHFGIVEAFIPANCTDTISPVDKHVAQRIKKMMYARFDEADDWETMSAEGKRRLVTTWANDVWVEFKRDSHHLVLSAFVKCGFLLAKDGSENGKIQLQNNLRPGEPAGLLPDGTVYVV
jgi:hypothetical protein